MSVLCVIPARFASSRFPGKPLALIAGEPMILHVWRRAKAARLVDAVVVATDDQRIADVCRAHAMDVVMTAADHETGTDRMAEVARLRPAEIYVNVQGDEPMIDPAVIDQVVARAREALASGIEVATGYVQPASEADARNPNVVHLVPTLDGCAMTFSRAPVPWPFREDFPRTIHVGLYAFTGPALARFAAWERGPIERAESIEILRFLERGERVAVTLLPGRAFGVDHPEDIAKVEAAMAGKSVAEAPPLNLADVRLLCLDVDGVMTDGGMYYNERGDIGRRYHVHDGTGILMAKAAGIEVAVITASNMAAIDMRALKLGLERLHAGCKDKLAKVREICAELGIGLHQVAAIGDDTNDLELLEAVGFPFTVANCVPAVRAKIRAVTTHAGGDGAIREVCELLVEAKKHP